MHLITARPGQGGMNVKLIYDLIQRCCCTHGVGGSVRRTANVRRAQQESLGA